MNTVSQGHVVRNHVLTVTQSFFKAFQNNAKILIIEIILNFSMPKCIKRHIININTVPILSGISVLCNVIVIWGHWLVRLIYSALIGQIDLLCSDWSDRPTLLWLVRQLYCALIGQKALLCSDWSDSFSVLWLDRRISMHWLFIFIYSALTGQIDVLFSDWSNGPFLLWLFRKLYSD